MVRPRARVMGTVTPMSGWNDVDDARSDLRARLRTSMKSRDPIATNALRSALGAIDNAEAPDVSTAPPAESAAIAGGVAGVGAAEVARRLLSAADVEAVIGSEIDERLAAAGELEGLDRRDAAAIVRAEAAVLSSILGDDRPPRTPA